MGTKTLQAAALGMLFAFVVSAAPAHAQATRTWVSGVGDDANPCSRTAPCKTFAGAISKTQAGGEIDCLDPGGFGAVTITKAITLDCTGTHGSILVAGTNGVVVNAGPNDKVTIRGLDLNGVGTGLDGIRFNAGSQLSVDQCFFLEFTQSGIEVNTTTAGDVYVTNTYITNVNKGIFATTTVPASIVSLNNVSILNAATNGFEANANIVATLTNTTITSTSNGVIASGGSQINVDTSTLINNTTAVNASVGGSVIRVSNNGMYNNGTNFAIAAGATVASTGNNRITAGGATVPNGTITEK